MAMNFAAAALLLLLAPAQAPAPAAEQGDVRTVTITVTDDKGRPVESLTPEEVAVVENGTTRTPTRLEKDRRPLRVAVVVDTSQPMADSYRLHVLNPLLKFLGKLPAGSEFAVWTTGDRPTKLVDYGGGTAAATRALQRVMTTGGNTLLDAVVEASKDLQAKEAARSAIVIVTGTGVGFTNYHREQVVDLVAPTGATVLAAQIDENVGAGAAGGGDVTQVDYDYVTGGLADKTGGRREVLLSPMGLGRVLDAFAGELGSQYRLSYLSDAAPKDRKLEVKVARPGAKVRVSAPRV